MIKFLLKLIAKFFLIVVPFTLALYNEPFDVDIILICVLSTIVSVIFNEWSDRL
jgi:hypothetical protein